MVRWVLVIVWCGLLVLSARGQEAAALMRYELVPTVAGRTVVAGRGLFLEARFTNSSDRDIWIPWGDTLYDDLFQFTVTDPDGKALVGPTNRPKPPVLMGGRKEFVQVRAGATVTYQIVVGSIGRNAQPWFFRKPGEYTLQGRYVATSDFAYVDAATGKVITEVGAWKGTLAAPSVKFTVVADPDAGEMGSQIAGRVLTATGEPIGGADVTITWVRLPPNNMPVGRKDGLIKTELDRVRTDEGGRFLAVQVPTHGLRFELKATHPQYVPGTLEVGNRLWPGELEAEVRLSRGVPMRGRVVDGAGEPIHGVAVRNYPADKAVFTDAEGRFEFAAAPEDNLHVDFYRVGYEMKSSGLLTVEQAKDLRVTLARGG